MKLTGKVTSIHAGSQYTDNQRRVTLQVKSGDDNKFTAAVALVVKDDKLDLDDEVAIVVTRASAAAQIA